MGIEFSFPREPSLFDAKIWTGSAGGRGLDDQRPNRMPFRLSRFPLASVASAHHVCAGRCRESTDSDWFDAEGS
jgi:hypothetical protein